MDAEGNPVEGPNFPCGLHDTGEKKTVDPSTLPNATQYVCPNHNGVMLTRQGRFGAFLGCSSYPKCKTVLKIKPDGTLQDGQEIVCTYNENAGTRGSKKTTSKATTKATGQTTKKTVKTSTAKATAESTSTDTNAKPASRTRAKKTVALVEDIAVTAPIKRASRKKVAVEAE